MFQPEMSIAERKVSPRKSESNEVQWETSIPVPSKLMRFA